MRKNIIFLFTFMTINTFSAEKECIFFYDSTISQSKSISKTTFKVKTDEINPLVATQESLNNSEISGIFFRDFESFVKNLGDAPARTKTYMDFINSKVNPYLALYSKITEYYSFDINKTTMQQMLSVQDKIVKSLSSSKLQNWISSVAWLKNQGRDNFSLEEILWYKEQVENFNSVHDTIFENIEQHEESLKLLKSILDILKDEVHNSIQLVLKSSMDTQQKGELSTFLTKKLDNITTQYMMIEVNLRSTQQSKTLFIAQAGQIELFNNSYSANLNAMLHNREIEHNARMEQLKLTDGVGKINSKELFQNEKDLNKVYSGKLYYEVDFSKNGDLISSSKIRKISHFRYGEVNTQLKRYYETYGEKTQKSDEFINSEENFYTNTDDSKNYPYKVGKIYYIPSVKPSIFRIIAINNIGDALVVHPDDYKSGFFSDYQQLPASAKVIFSYKFQEAKKYEH